MFTKNYMQYLFNMAVVKTVEQLLNGDYIQEKHIAQTEKKSYNPQ